MHARLAANPLRSFPLCRLFYLMKMMIERNKYSNLKGAFKVSEEEGQEEEEELGREGGGSL